ncbi:MAG: DUF493 domain-containing protein [Desulfarculaceae bacterium]|nr:DUF493 domain-containing protein [Desulfarculaceae bacterium]MCF8071816.1 DUF493 domain-containing protein [Desulfarculaceae bacterium]MCF8101366.1 DUF493 domain-containing protein [Desulfarculaceae bacterium]MCF8117173.1 DUF493 domain-containing protein [Desulfarculaceae bacterium]
MHKFTDPSQATPPASREESLQLLEQFHDFPGPYMFKVIAFDSEDLAAEVRRQAEAVLGPLTEQGSVRTRPSSGGKYLSVTLEAELASAEQVLQVYESLKQVEGLVAMI